MTGKILIDRAVVEQVLEAMMATHYKMIDAGILDQDLLNKNFTAHEAIKDALAEQPAGQDDYKAWYDEAMRASNEAGFVGVDAAQTIRELTRQLAEAPQPAKPAEQEPWTPRELELIDGMIEVQLNHAERCDHIANRTMAEKQKEWDMERVALLQKIRAHGIGG